MPEEETYIFDEELPEGDAEEIEEGDLVPEGVHDVVIDHVQLYPPKDDKAAQISLKLKITGGAAEGETILHYVNLPKPGEKPATRRARLLMLKRLGIISQEDFERGQARVDYGLIGGVECTVEIEHNTWEKEKGGDGVTRAKVKFMTGFHEFGWRPEGDTGASSAAGGSPASGGDAQATMNLDDI